LKNNASIPLFKVVTSKSLLNVFSMINRILFSSSMASIFFFMKLYFGKQIYSILKEKVKIDINKNGKVID